MNVKPEDTIGGRLKQWRVALGLTQAQLAERLEVHIGVLKKYEQGLNVPGGEALAAIARTGVDMRWLLTGEGEMLPKPASDQAFGAIPYARRLEKIGLLLADMDEKDAAALLDELHARAQDKAEAAALRRALTEVRAEIERLKKTA